MQHSLFLLYGRILYPPAQDTVRIRRNPMYKRRILLLFMLGAEVEGHHHGDNDHHIIRAEGPPESQHRKDSRHHQGDDGLDFNKIRQVFQNLIHTYSPLSRSVSL